MEYTFGKDITYTFTPLLDSNTIANIPAQTAKLWLFDSIPSYSEALVGTGAIASVVNATWTLNATSCTFTIPAIDDPWPTSSVQEADYYVSVVFKLTTGEQDQATIRELCLTRLVGHDEAISVVSADLEAVYPYVIKYASSTQITAQISLALSWLKRSLKGKGYEYQLIHNLNDLKLTVTYRALAQIMISLIKPGSVSEFQTLYDDYNATALSFLDSFTAEYDPENTGTDQVEEQIPSFQIVSR